MNVHHPHVNIMPHVWMMSISTTVDVWMDTLECTVKLVNTLILCILLYLLLAFDNNIHLLKN